MTNYLEPVVQKLEADIAEYVAKLAEAKAAMEDLQKSTAKSQASMSKDGDKIEQAFDDIAKDSGDMAKSVEKDGKKVEDSFEGVGEQAKKTSDDVDKSTKKSKKDVDDFAKAVTGNMKDGKTAFQSLTLAVAETKTKITSLKSAFGASGGDKDIFGDLQKAKNDLKQLEGYLKDATGDFKNSGNKSGTGFIGSFFATVKNLIPNSIKSLTGDVTSGFKNVFSSVTTAMDGLPWGGIIKSILVGAAVLAAPAILSILSAAVLTAFGSGIIALGIFNAVHDPKVFAAFSELKRTAGDVFGNAAKSFIGPTLNGLHVLRDDIANMAPGLRDMFTKLSGAAEPLIAGFGGFITGMLPGFESGMKAAAPLVLELAKLLPWLGQQIGDMFADFGKAGSGARLALQGIIGTLGLVLHAVGWLAEYGSKAFTVMEGAIATFVHTAADAVGAFSWIPGLGGKFQQAHDHMEGFADGIDRSISAAKASQGPLSQMGLTALGLAGANTTLAQTYAELVTANSKWVESMQKNDNSLLAMKEAQTNFNEQLKVGKKNWDENTKGGQGNVAALNQANQAITAYYDSLAATTPLTEAQTRAELKAEKSLYARAKANGATNAELATMRGTIAGLNSELKKLDGQKIHFTVSGSEKVTFTSNAPSSFWHGTAKGSVVDTAGVVHAAKGYVSGILPPRSPGTLMLAGEPETGGEVFAPLRGISQSRAMSLAQVIGDSYGFDVRRRNTAGASASIIGAGGSPVPGGGGSSASHSGGPINLVMSNQIIARFQAALISPSQRYKSRTGTTGLA